MAVAATRQQILNAALKRFAAKGYAATSVQEIVDAARVTKPSLYYYFRNKAGLYRALVDWAFEERFRLMQEAAARQNDLRAQLTEICAASFAFARRNRELMRLAFATAFAGRGEVPAEAQCLKKSRRNFDFLCALFRAAAARGELRHEFTPEELTMNFVGTMTIYVMAYSIGITEVLEPDPAQNLVQIFLLGASKPSASITRAAA